VADDWIGGLAGLHDGPKPVQYGRVRCKGQRLWGADLGRLLDQLDLRLWVELDLAPIDGRDRTGSVFLRGGFPAVAGLALGTGPPS
jgi:hypothetical protein